MTARRGLLLVFLAATGFGTLGIFGKLATAAALNTPTLLTIRFVLATAVLGGYLAIRGNTARPNRRQFATMLGLGVPYAVLTGGYFWGLSYVPAGLATVTLYTYPVYVYAASTVFLDERLTPLKAAALLLALSGIVAIVGLDTTGADPVGLTLVSIAAIGYAAYTTGNRLAVGTIDADRLATGAIATTGVCAAVYGAVTDTLFVPTTVEQWAIIAGIAIVSTALPVVLFVNGLRHLEASRASVVATAEPVVAVVLGVVVLGERLSPGILVGGTLVLTGVVLVQRGTPDEPSTHSLADD